MKRFLNYIILVVKMSGNRLAHIDISFMSVEYWDVLKYAIKDILKDPSIIEVDKVKLRAALVVFDYKKAIESCMIIEEKYDLYTKRYKEVYGRDITEHENRDVTPDDYYRQSMEQYIRYPSPPHSDYSDYMFGTDPFMQRGRIFDVPSGAHTDRVDEHSPRVAETAPYNRTPIPWNEWFNFGRGRT